MKSFKERVKGLLAVTTNEAVRIECNKVMELASYANDAGLRDMLLTNLKGLKLTKAEEKFVLIEQKLTILDTMGLNETFKEVYEGTILKDNPRLSYPLNAIHAAYQSNSASTVSLAEGMVKVLQPYVFNPIIEKHVNYIKGLLEAYAEDIVVINAIDKIQRMRSGHFYTEVLEKLGAYLLDNESMTRRELITDLQKYSYEPMIQETLRSLIKFDEGNSLYIVNENKNFKIESIYSFMYFDTNEKNKYYFANMGTIFLKDSDGQVKALTEAEVNQLPNTFKQINSYITKPSVKINKDRVSIYLEKGNIEFVVNEDKANEAFLNGIRMEVAPYQYLIQSGLFGYGVQEELQTIGKIWEHLDTLVEIDFGKNIVSNVYPGVSATLYKTNESFYIQLRNIPQRQHKLMESLNGLQARNAILEFMRYDITESLYEYLQGPEAEISKLRADQKIIENDIVNITNQIAKIDNAKKDVLIGENEELNQIRIALAEEIDFLKGKYNELTEDINVISKGNDISESEGLRPGHKVKVKATGVIGAVTAINTITKVVAVLTEDGETISCAMDDVEILTDKLFKSLDGLETKGKEVEKVGESLTEGQRIFGGLANKKVNKNG